MDRSGTPALALFPSIPVMTKERFAELVGVEVGVVRGMLDRRHLPSVKIGRHRFVNVAALAARCLAEDSESGYGVREDSAQYGRC
ncbi:MAG TPA: hypothetical protein VF254_07200 [Gammaproteobacteria bacterium]